jgi:hypothetical protein
MLLPSVRRELMEIAASMFIPSTSTADLSSRGLLSKRARKSCELSVDESDGKAEGINQNTKEYASRSAWVNADFYF